jgi:hypothetical protein
MGGAIVNDVKITAGPILGMALAFAALAILVLA